MNKENNQNSKYKSPKIETHVILSKEILRNTNIEEIKKLKAKMLKINNPKKRTIIQFMEEQYNQNFGDRISQTDKDALGDFSEATTTLFLLESWKVSDQIDIKWIHPDTGSAPKRGIDITAFSDTETITKIDGILIFEVKGATTANSLKSQLNKIKKFINRDETQIGKEVQELMSIINEYDVNLPDSILECISGEKPLIRLNGSLVTDISLQNNEEIGKFINNIKQNKRGLPKGLIMLYSENIVEEVNRFNKEV